MSKIWVVSDTHFLHNRPFLYAPRGFNSIEEHDEAIIKNWNEVVSKNDTVIHLGDIYMTANHEKGCRLINRLNGNIILIRGNHDSDNKVQAISENCPKVEILGYSTPFKYKGYNFYLSHYPCLVSNYDEDKPVKDRIVCLCGHTHTEEFGKDLDKGFIIHCELDAWNNYPVNLDTIIKLFLGENK